VEETGIPADAIDVDPQFRFEHRYHVQSKRTGGETWLKTLVILLGRLTRDVEIEVTEHEGFRWFPWSPPHHVQPQTIDPLLEAVAKYVAAG
jgi:bis(5'-nucleosidyl)-tetraphosphatase